MPKHNRALGAQMTITPKELVQSYGDWILDYLSFPHQEDLITHLQRRKAVFPHATMEQVYKWTAEYLGLEWKAYFLTFLFRHIPGPAPEKMRQMHREIVRFYGKLASWVVRSPRSPKCAYLLPRAVFFPDGPCYKRQKQALRDVSINDGLHFHGLILVPNKSRLKVPFLQHLRDKKRSYGRGYTLTTHAEPIWDQERFVADYGGKAVKRGRVSYDDVLVLPRTGKELQQDTSESLSGPDREIKDIMCANNVSIEMAKAFYENVRKCRRQGRMKQG
jgi:hypothetical protein